VICSQQRGCVNGYKNYEMKKNRTKEWHSVKRINWLLDKAIILTDELKRNLDKFAATKQSYVLNCHLYDELLEEWSNGN